MENIKQVFVRNLSGKTLTIDISQMCFVSELKNEIFKRESIDQSSQVLSYSSRILQNNEHLESYDLQNLSTINLSLRLKGGSKSSHHNESLMEKIVRNKIYDSKYYKQQCFGLNAETIVERVSDLNCIGGTYGGYRHPTKFLCLLFKMLQINVQKEIIYEFIENEHWKYLTVLGAVYLRLIGRPKEIYLRLEPLLLDFRKIRIRNQNGEYEIKRMDEIIDDLLRRNFYFDINLPVIPKRIIMEKKFGLKERVSPIIDFFDPSEFEIEEEKKKKNSNKLVFKGDKGDEEVTFKLEKTENEISMSVDDSNKLREKLGLPPLQM